MRSTPIPSNARLALLLVFAAVGGLALPTAAAEPTNAPQRGRRDRPSEGVYKAQISPHWFAGGTRFWYRNHLPDGRREFVLVDAPRGTRLPAFDHARLAEGLSNAVGQPFEGDRLPFDEIEFVDDDRGVRIEIDGTSWTCELDTYECLPTPTHNAQDAAPEEKDGPSTTPPQEDSRRERSRRSRATRTVGSPDGQWTATVRDGNIFLRAAAEDPDPEGAETTAEEEDALAEKNQLSHDGTAEHGYGMLDWSPDSKALVAFRIEAGDRHEVHLIESSPDDGGRAKLRSRPYALPGDRFTAYELNLFDVATRRQMKPDVEPVDFGRPRLRWNSDGRRFTFQKTNRGHQRFRVIEVDTHTGTVRNLVDERSDTFIWTAHAEHRGLPLVTWLEQSGEMIYASERDGWRHLYLVDAGETPAINQITCGEFVVRGIDHIDQENREIWFRAGGRHSEQDPYFIHFYRVRFDGSGLVALTDGDGNHSVQFSPDRQYLIDTYSRVDMPPVHELRRTCDGSLVCDLERADISQLEESGWRPPEVFVAKGRDGQTDVWGIIQRPRDFDPEGKYPIIEDIYAGPHSAYVPKSFSASRRYASLTDRGFIVVKIDGMGTAHRSKAFHDVCWHNLKDAGLPDRIGWIKAAAKEYPYMDMDRVGIYGTSAGGQSAAGAMLFHPEFYKAAVASCGCHDNRMDKASWNEQWMGYPVGPHYAASSNIDNAHRLKGHLMLIVGELDNNVPPESTLRLVDALVTADKDFDLLFLPGAGHTSGGAYGRRRMEEFFVRHLQSAQATGVDVASTGETRPVTQIVSDEQRPQIDLASIDADQQPIDRLAARYRLDRASLERFYPLPESASRQARLRQFDSHWLAALEQLGTEKDVPEDEAPFAPLTAEIRARLADVENDAEAQAAISHLAPFAGDIIRLTEARQRLESIEPRQAASELAEIGNQINQRHAELRRQQEDAPDAECWQPVQSWGQAAETTENLRGALQRWFDAYDGYDPLFTWWVNEPFATTDKELEEYQEYLAECAARIKSRNQELAAADGIHEDVPELDALISGAEEKMPAIIGKFQDELRELFRNRRRGRRQAPSQEDRARQRNHYATWRQALEQIDFERLCHSDQVDYLLIKNHLDYRLVREERGDESRESRPPAPDDASRLVGRPIGRDALLRELAHEMIPYTPDELIEIGRREYAWCEAELKRAAAEMGCGDDWQQAVEKVKNMHVGPGRQPELIRQLADEAVEFLTRHQLVTVPPLAQETWRMRMMSPERQLINPFFTGGEVISVSFPTDAMSHEAKLQSMRGNNIPFARATVHHELIPGHHLQGFMTARHRPYRRLFATPFWGEGWALYWEMVLYDRGFASTPEDRVGFLVWRAHRCARIIFSLSFHLGRMTPDECVDLLVAHVGFERNNATAEVRRSIGDGYSPLYQAAYMLGGLQIRRLRAELVDSGQMSERRFHDRILRENSIPIEMLRAILTEEPLCRDFQPTWRFADMASDDDGRFGE